MKTKLLSQISKVADYANFRTNLGKNSSKKNKIAKMVILFNVKIFSAISLESIVASGRSQLSIFFKIFIGVQLIQLHIFYLYGSIIKFLFLS